MTVFVIVLHTVLIYINRLHFIWHHSLNLLLSLIYITLLCLTMFVYGKSHLFLACVSIDWGLGLLSYLSLFIFDLNGFNVIMLLVFYCTSAPLIGTLEFLRTTFPAVIRPMLSTVLSLAFIYALFWAFHLLGKYYERRKIHDG